MYDNQWNLIEKDIGRKAIRYFKNFQNRKLDRVAAFGLKWRDSPLLIESVLEFDRGRKNGSKMDTSILHGETFRGDDQKIVRTACDEESSSINSPSYPSTYATT